MSERLKMISYFCYFSPDFLNFLNKGIYVLFSKIYEIWQSIVFSNIGLSSIFIYPKKRKKRKVEYFFSIRPKLSMQFGNY